MKSGNFPPRPAWPRIPFSLRSGTVLGSIFLVLLLLTTGVLLLFSHYVLQTYQEQYHNELIQGRFSRMENRSDRLYGEIDSLSEQIDALTRRQDCSRLMVLSDIAQSDLSMDVALYLSSIVHSHDTVEEVWIFFAQSDMILCSDQELLPRSQSEHRSLLRLYRQQRDAGKLIRMNHSSLFTSGGQLYMAIDYPRSSPLISIVLELDAQVLWDDMMGGSEVAGAADSYVYSLDGTPLFSRQAGYPDQIALQVTGPAQSLWGAHCYAYQKAGEDDTLLLVYREPDTDLVQVMEVNTRDLTPITGIWLQEVIPYAALALCLMLAASLYLFYKICLPLRRVVGSLAADREPDRVALLHQQSENELALVENMVEDDRKRRETMQEMLTQVQESVREKLLLSIFRSDGEYDQLLEELSRTGQFPSHGRYGVLYLELQREEADQSEAILSQVRLTLVIEEACQQAGTCCRVKIGTFQTAWLLQLSDTCPKGEFDRLISRLRRSLAREEGALPCQAELGGAPGGGGLAEIKTLYDQARRDAHAQRYYRSQGKRPTDQYAAYREKILQALQQVSGNPESSGVDWDKLVDELVQNDPSGGVKGLGMILDLFMEQMIHLQIGPEENWSLLRQGLGDPSQPLGESDPRIRQVKEFIALSVSRLQALKRSRQYQHISRARDYIAAHFGDSDLSLELVSEQIGTTGSYLSHLFSSCLSCGFLDYLNRYRISQAEKLLKATDLTVSEIGLHCGFNSPQNFIRVFKKYTGSTPGQYRAGKGDR